MQEEASGDTSPVDSLILDIQTPELREDKAPLFKSPVCGVREGTHTLLPNTFCSFPFHYKKSNVCFDEL